jgi:hypothetical protein
MDDQALMVAPQLSEVASSGEQLSQIQSQMMAWAGEKLAETRKEYEKVDAAAKQAKLRKWNPAPLRAAASRALLRVQYYEKVCGALAAGYMLFPAFNWVEVIAIRTRQLDQDLGIMNGNPRPTIEAQSECPPAGAGEYKSPAYHWTVCGSHKVEHLRSDGTKYYTDEREWRSVSSELKDAVFPLVMARAECVEVTSRAMEQKVFDRIAIYPARARKDPVILGQIWDKKRGRWLNFLISWRIDKRDL